MNAGVLLIVPPRALGVVQWGRNYAIHRVRMLLLLVYCAGSLSNDPGRVVLLGWRRQCCR